MCVYVDYFKNLYLKYIILLISDEFGYRNLFSVPKIMKIVLNIGVKNSSKDPKSLEDAFNILTLLSGQKAVFTKSKKSISSFQLRKGMNVGLKVTLRGVRMYEFLYRLVTIAMPRIKDFRGISSDSFDGKGNLTIGIKECGIFPEVNLNNIVNVHGINISIVTTAFSDYEAFVLFNSFNLPFLL